MKAIVFEEIGGPEVMKIAEVPKPEVKPGMVLIKVRAAGINFADTLFRRGQYAMQPKLPDTPGLEGAGEIEAVGADDGQQDVRGVCARARGAGDSDP
jgi:NADPH:quinone reductase